MIWILSIIASISIILNIVLIIKSYNNKNYCSERDKELRVALNSFEAELRLLRNKYGLGK